MYVSGALLSIKFYDVVQGPGCITPFIAVNCLLIVTSILNSVAHVGVTNVSHFFGWKKPLGLCAYAFLKRKAVSAMNTGGDMIN